MSDFALLLTCSLYKTALVTETEQRGRRLRSEATSTLYAVFHIFDDLTVILTRRFQEFFI